MTDNVFKFPSNKIVRHNPNGAVNAPGVARGGDIRQAKIDAKNVIDNLRFELFETYKIVQTKEVNIDMPLLEDIITGIFRRNAELDDEPEPPPLRYA